MPTSRAVVVGLALALSVADARAADRFVGLAGVDVGSCSASADPCGSLAYALTQATSGDTVKISGGSYAGNVLIDTSTNLAISGGWSADFTSRDPAVHRTSLRGVAGAPPFSGPSLSDVLVVRASSGDAITLSLDGLTIRHGTRGLLATADTDAVLALQVVNCVVQGNLVGGIRLVASGASAVSATVSTTIVSSNSNTRWVLYGGPGINIHTQSSVPMTVNVVDSRIERNRLINTYGAGMSAGASAPGSLVLDIERCTFFNNRSTGGAAGGLAAFGPQLDLSIRDSVFTRNGAQQTGGMYLEGTNFTLSNVTVSRNGHPADYGGAIYAAGGSGTIVNSTVSRNRGNAGLGVGLVTLTLRNSIFWGQRPTSSPDVDVASVATVDADHTDIGTLAGTVNDLGGNISTDPRFVSSNDFHLTASSPCIDTGTCTGAPATDADGDPRPTGGGCDIGADEFVP